MEHGGLGRLGQCGPLVTRPVETDGEPDRERVSVIIPRQNMAARHAADLTSRENPDFVYENIVQERTDTCNQ